MKEKEGMCFRDISFLFTFPLLLLSHSCFVAPGQSKYLCLVENQLQKE